MHFLSTRREGTTMTSRDAARLYRLAVGPVDEAARDWINDLLGDP